MTTATDELLLLERVFLRLGSADTDEQLQSAVNKFLPPVLLKLSSPHEEVRKKVMELLVHINKRVKSRPQIQLPVEALLLQYQDPAASSFVTNFTIIYIKLGFPRLDIKKQAELIPNMLNAIQGKPTANQDSSMLLIMPAIGHLNIPIDSEKRSCFLGLQDEPKLKKLLLNFMLDMLLLPYGAINEKLEPGKPIDWAKFPVPAGMSEYSFKRVIGDNPATPEQLEQIKIGIVKFLSGGFLPDSDILLHLIVASSDTRFGVANLADMELKKIANTLDWSSLQLTAPLYGLFLGSEALATQKDLKPELKKTPANTRIRLKLMYYLCRVTKDGFYIPPCIQIVFDSLYGASDTNSKLKSMALQFTLNFVQQCSLAPLNRVAKVILTGMLKLITEEAEVSHKLMAYTIIGHLGSRIPSLVNKDLNLVKSFFEELASNEGDMRRTIRDSLVCMTSAFILNKNEETEMSTMIDFLSDYIESPEPYVRFVAVHYAATIFPSDYAPSRYLLLLASGDQKPEVQSEALKALYGTAYKNERSKYFIKQNVVPDFSCLMSYIFTKVKTRNDVSKKVSVGNKNLPFNISTFAEIISYLRICLAKSSNVGNQTDSLEHPSDDTPVVGRYLEKLYKENPDSVYRYVDIIVLFGQPTGDEVALSALLEVIGSIPSYTVENYKKEKSWIYNLLFSKKDFIRELAAKNYAIFSSYDSITDFESQILKLIGCTKDKVLETQQGALMALSHILERRLVIEKKYSKTEVFNLSCFGDAVKTICDFLTANSSLLSTAAIDGIGLIGKSSPFPLQETSEDDSLSKKAIVDSLFGIFTNPKANQKLKEKAALSLGLICVGEEFPHSKMIAEKFISLSEETKDLNIHLCAGEALVCCVQGPASSEARNSWEVLPSEHNVPFTKNSDDLLVAVIDNLLSLVSKTHPNTRQAVCTWLLLLVKYNSSRKCIYDKMMPIHNAFLDFLSEKSDVVQDIATRGLYLVYHSCTEADKKLLVTEIMNQILYGRNEIIKVAKKDSTDKTEESTENSITGNLTSYKEICGLAIDLEKPELAYEFLHISNTNPLWTSKKGILLGFSQNSVSNELMSQSAIIIPRLFRYQHDPLSKVQQTFTNIWRAIVPSTSKAIEQHHLEILERLTTNLTHPMFRVRISCCQGLIDLFKTPNIPISYVDIAPELWKQLFKVMDDIHAGTRLAAENATRIFSRVCIRRCDPSHGKSSEQILHAILPVLLEIGITHSEKTIRMISLQTIAQLVNSAGALLKPSLVTLIPALLNSVGDLESPSIMSLRNSMANSSDAQEILDDFTVETAKNSFSAETMSKCIYYIDAEILKELMPKIIELMKSTLRFGTVVACSNFLMKLSVHMKQELQPYSSKILAVLKNGLLDRNPGIRKNNAVMIGHIVGCAKESSLDKLFNMLNKTYMEQEDVLIRLAIGQTLQSISNHNPDVIKKYSHVVMPLTFFAMHCEKDPEEKKTEELWEMWNNLWSEITPGTEAGIRQNLELITSFLSNTLESSSWTVKAQSANAICTLATKLGSTIDEASRNSLLKMLTSGLQGRTWNGKERLLNALAVLTCNSKEVLKQDEEMKKTIVDVLLRESKKENLEYRRQALKAFSDVLHELEEDRFVEFYGIAQEILGKLSKKEDDDEDSILENKKKREDKIKLQEVVYEGLGKAWPPDKETQDNYCLEFIYLCLDTLPSSTRPVQVAILTSVGLFVEKLILLKTHENQSSDLDKEHLDMTCKALVKILRYSIGIAKYTKIRKEALNIVIHLSKKLKDNHYCKQFDSITVLMKDMLAELSKDNQPEIRSRIVDIKDMLKL